MLPSLPLPTLPRLRHLRFCVVGRYQTLPCPPGLLSPGLQIIALTRVALSVELIHAIPVNISSLNLSYSFPDEDLVAWLASVRVPAEIFERALKKPDATVNMESLRVVLTLGWWLLDRLPALTEFSWHSFGVPLNGLLLHPRVASKEVVLRGVFQ